MREKEYYCDRCGTAWRGTWVCPSCRELASGARDYVDGDFLQRIRSRKSTQPNSQQRIEAEEGINHGK